MKIKIEKGIPIPDSPHRATGIIKAMKKMRFGDSFLFKGKSVSNVHVYAKMAKIKLVTRSVDDKGTRRCWRIA